MSVVIGVGTENGGDDVAGLLVVRALRDQVPAGVGLVESGGDPGALIAAWEGVDRAVVVDAVRTGAPPGTVQRLDPDRISGVSEGGWSSHGIGLAGALALAEALGRGPRSLGLVGVEGACFATGAPPSDALLGAVSAAADTALRALACPGRSASGTMGAMADVQARVVTTELEHPTEVALVSHGLRSRDLVVSAWNQHGQQIDVHPEIVDEDTVRVYPAHATGGAPVRIVVVG